MKPEYDFSQSERGRFYRGNTRLNVPAPREKPRWEGPKGRLGRFAAEQAEKSLEAYRAQPNLVAEHANLEHDTARGGYAHRQLFELVQNSADSLIDAQDGKSILVRLTADFLYCADDGDPVDERGIEGLMFARLSSKRDTAAIGRFGLGFKAVLGVSGAPEFYSRDGSFRFDGARAAKRITGVAPDAERYPALRLPEPIDPLRGIEEDEELRELTSWACNIVRLPLKAGARDDLARQIRDFPPEFILFVDHVRYLTLEDSGISRSFVLDKRNGELRLDTGGRPARWRCFEKVHSLSPEARQDRRSLDDSGDVTIRWAAPLDRLDSSGHFWAFFPTKTASLVAGIVNAPWKTNEDRQNLLPGPYNDELIDAAAETIADGLPELATETDPACHLDALPRRHEAGDSEQSTRLRNNLLDRLRNMKIVPDQDGKLQAIEAVSYPPGLLTDSAVAAPLDRWSAFRGRPSGWLHRDACTRKRLAVIDRLFPLTWRRGVRSAARRATIAEWLEALVPDRKAGNAVEASRTALQTAALIPREARLTGNGLGHIVLTANDGWLPPDPARVFLPDDGPDGEDTSFVHPDLASDRSTLEALKKLGIRPPSPESSFKRLADKAMRSGESEPRRWTSFWMRARKLGATEAFAIVREYKDYEQREVWLKRLRVRTRSDAWRPLHTVLLPGAVVPGDGSRDKPVTVDMDFHRCDLELLGIFRVAERPSGDRDLRWEDWFNGFQHKSRVRFTNSQHPETRSQPRQHLLNFIPCSGSGPLQVLTELSDEGRALYTDALLLLDSTFEKWSMRHDTRGDYYRTMQFDSPAICILREYGRIRTNGGIVPFKDALGPEPKNPAALHALLSRENSDRIRKAFDIADPTPEFFGEQDSIPLIDVWPGLGEYLPPEWKDGDLIRCERILVGEREPECLALADNVYNVYLVGADDDLRELRPVANALGLGLGDGALENILRRRAAREIEERRARVRQCATDAERLLAAVGERNLRRELPPSLLAILEPRTAVQVAEAAIATYHSDALQEYRRALDHLDPPKRWAGSARGVAFVQALGFSAEWAGERNRRRPPFEEVDGPCALPPLHEYQRFIVERIRRALRDGRASGASRRGMISLPTGAGKTRVAVQAVVEAMREDGFSGGVLWVADRDELCEQGVEAWRQVWSSDGPRVRLRISRMWAGQPKPLPTNESHVVVATIQTLNARLSARSDEYGFLSDFGLVVFDEAHRSIAPSYTSAMQEIGLTRRRGANGPFLFGLTATPYRGYSEGETRWLANRYGGVRFDAGAFASDDSREVVSELQDMRVLARAEHQTIDGGVFSLSDEELEQMAATAWLPRSAEDRIADDKERTRRIVEAYERYVDKNWSCLVFATSVEHARTVAALLNAKGIVSRAVSGATDRATRRRVVEEFRCNRIKALVNYGVFREGFDAPKTRAIIVARPVYSPNLYFQMIGRGLRGKKNGGNDRCLILNVRDNIANFDRELAFSDLDWLWERPAADPAAA